MSGFNINIMDIQKKQYDRDLKRKNIYNTILEQCFHKINSTADNEHEHCFYRVPEYMIGVPIYNLTKCVIYILQKLRENGFKCKYCHPFMIYVSWKHKNNTLLIENIHALPKNKIKQPPKPEYYKSTEKNNLLDSLLFKKEY